MAVLATLSGIFWATSSTVIFEVYDWLMPSDGIASWMGFTLLDLALVGTPATGYSPSHSIWPADECGRAQAHLPKSSYGCIPEKTRGKTYADTLMWRCAVPQRAGPG
jgi:hypothetical protein